MIIARRGNFGLLTKAYLAEHEYFTSDITLVKYNYDERNHEYCYCIGDFEITRDGNANLISYGNRILDAIEDKEDINNLKILSRIGLAIIACDDIPSGFKQSIEY